MLKLESCKPASGNQSKEIDDLAKKLLLLWEELPTLKHKEASSKVYKMKIKLAKILKIGKNISKGKL